MLAIQSRSPQKCTPNLLPARLNHNGPIRDAERYWQPTKDEQEKSHAYFRGRHLHGITIPVPPGYTGAVLRITNEPAQQSQAQAGRDADDDQGNEDDGDDVQTHVDTKAADKVATFDEIMVWGHASEVDAHQDAFIRSVTEWVGFAEAMHTSEEENTTESKR